MSKSFWKYFLRKTELKTKEYSIHPVKVLEHYDLPTYSPLLSPKNIKFFNYIKKIFPFFLHPTQQINS